MKLSKFNLVTAITATALVSGALILPTVWSSVNHNPTSTQLNNNSNIQNTQKTKSLTNLQVVNSVDEIVVEDVNIIDACGYAIVKNNGIQEVYAWGWNTNGQLGVGDRVSKPSPTKVLLPIFDTDTVIKSISFNFYSSHVLLERNGFQELYVWGHNIVGILGLGHSRTLEIPTPFPLSIFGNGILREIVFNYFSSYAIIDRTSNQTDIYVWGANDVGQLGLGDTSHRSSPVLLSLSATMYGWNLQNAEISNRNNGIASYALYEKNGIQELYVWGDNAYGELGLNTNDPYKNTPQLFPSFRFNNGRIISFRFEHKYMSWALVENNGIKRLYTGGLNTNGQLGLGSDTAATATHTVISASVFNNGEIMDVGSYGNYGMSMYAIVNVNGILRIYTWGYNAYGQIGNNSTTNVLTPYAIPITQFNNGIIESYSFGMYNTMVVARVGNEQQVFVWGYNAEGYLGLNSTTNISIPTRLNNLLFNESNIALPKNRTNINNTMFSLRKDARTSYYISGYNFYGQLGDGTTTRKLVHTQILPTTFTNPIANETEEAIKLKTNISAPDAMQVINADNVVSKTELAKYVDLTSLPPNAVLSIDTYNTKINHEQGTIDLVINSNQYYDQLIVPAITVPLISLKEYKVSITGFKQVKDININPVSVKTKLTSDINNVDNILKPLVDANNEIKPFIDENNTIINPNRLILEQYLDLSAIPLDAIIVLNWTVDKQNNNISIDFKSNHVYNNNGLTIKDENYITNFLFKTSSLDIALIAILVGAGLVALVISLIIFYKIRTNRRQSMIGY